MDIKNKTILITGGTGSFGHAMTRELLRHHPQKVIIFSRDEYKQFLMRREFRRDEKKLRFFLGDVRDRERLYRAFYEVDIVIHAAALKQVPALEYNPIEAIRTNIMGAINVIDAAIDRKVRRVVALSTDKAVNPINLYGGTKLVSDKLFISANAYTGAKNTTFSVVRYGNVAGSRGSVIPYFRELIKNKSKFLPITDVRMTRFWMTLDLAVDLVLEAIRNAKGAEIYVAKIPSFKVVDLVRAMGEKIKIKEVGVRPGEKLHEVMIAEEDARMTREYGKFFIIYPNLDWWEDNRYYHEGGKKVVADFRYGSNLNKKWLTVLMLKEFLKKI